MKLRPAEPNTLDFETASELPLKGKASVGVHRYAEHHSTHIMFLTYKLRDGKTQIWFPDKPFPEDLLRAIENNEVFDAHNAQFERAIWFRLIYEKGIAPMPRRWIDTMAVCAYRSIPMGLDDVGRVLGLPIRKDPRGETLIQKLCKPRKPLKADKEIFKAMGLEEHEWPVLWNRDPDLMEEFIEYGMTDTESEHCLRDTIGYLPESEQKLWVLDQTINWRGIRVDMEAVNAAKKVADMLKEKLGAELTEITNGVVETGNQVQVIRQWLEDNGLPLPNLQADTLDHVIAEMNREVQEGGSPEEMAVQRRVIEIRQQIGSTSLAKLDKFIQCVCTDMRIKGLLQYHGAGTGRWAGRLVQPQNFPRGSLEAYCKQFGLEDREDEMMEKLIADIIFAAQHSDPDYLYLIYGDPMEAISTALRGMFIADHGKKFYVADFSAIEAVVTSWLAGEQWKLDAFAAIQRKEGYKGSPDIYCATASMVFGYPVTDKKRQTKERGVGKVCELAFGYQGGVNAWWNFDKSGRYSEDEIDGFKEDWREQHPATKALWKGLNTACIDAVRTGKAHSYQGIIFKTMTDKAGKWLTCRLPSGRLLWYFNPMLEETVVTPRKGDPFTSVSVGYEGRDNKRGGAWGWVRTYGGMLTENIVQAISRDIMAEAMFRVEALGYPIVLTVHDEIVAETDEDFGDKDEFEEAMSVLPAWLTDCPVAVDGWVGTRYRK